MSESDRVKHLKFALRVFAAVFTFGFYPLTVFWPSGWAWHVGLISFTIWSSIVHAGTMAVLSVANAQHFGHLYGDVPALFVVAAVLAWLSPQALTLTFAKNAA